MPPAGPSPFVTAALQPWPEPPAVPRMDQCVCSRRSWRVGALTPSLNLQQLDLLSNPLSFRSAVSHLPLLFPMQPFAQAALAERQVGEPAAGGGSGPELPNSRGGGGDGSRQSKRPRDSWILALLVSCLTWGGSPSPSASVSPLVEWGPGLATSQRVIVRTRETEPVGHLGHSARPVIGAQ